MISRKSNDEAWLGREKTGQILALSTKVPTRPSNHRGGLDLEVAVARRLAIISHCVSAVSVRPSGDSCCGRSSRP